MFKTVSFYFVCPFSYLSLSLSSPNLLLSISHFRFECVVVTSFVKKMNGFDSPLDQQMQSFVKMGWIFVWGSAEWETTYIHTLRLSFTDQYYLPCNHSLNTVSLHVRHEVWCSSLYFTLKTTLFSFWIPFHYITFELNFFPYIQNR